MEQIIKTIETLKEQYAFSDNKCIKSLINEFGYDPVYVKRAFQKYQEKLDKNLWTTKNY